MCEINNINENGTDPIELCDNYQSILKIERQHVPNRIE
jgi:hypothetical protein